MNVAIVGGSSCNKKNYAIAEELGSLVADRGWKLICGGGFGVMEAACKGAKKRGGITIGILPTHDDKETNAYLDIKIPTGLGYARNILIVRAAEYIIAVNGKQGTLSEIAFALNESKPIVGINTWDIKGLKKVKNPKEAIDFINKKIKKINELTK